MKKQICYFKGSANQMKTDESGRTMLEMLGVLGIMGIIMYGAVAGINYGMSTYKINQIYNEVQEAVQSIQDIYSWQRGYNGINASTLCQNDVFVRCDSDSGEPKNVYEGDISVSAISDGASFKVSYAGIDKEICYRLKEMDWGTILMGTECTDEVNTIDFCPKETADQADCS